MRKTNILFTAISLVMLCGCSITHTSSVSVDQAVHMVSVDGFPTGRPYSSGVTANGMLYSSGTIAFIPGSTSFPPADIDVQTHQVFANLKKILAAAGCDWDDVVKANVYLKNPNDFAGMNAVYVTYFTGHKPARTTVPNINWGRDDILVEIDVIAKLPH